MGSATVASDGSWVFGLNFDLSIGTHTIKATATNGISVASAIVTFFFIACDPNIDALTQALRAKYGE